MIFFFFKDFPVDVEKSVISFRGILKTLLLLQSELLDLVVERHTIYIQCFGSA